MSDRDTNQDSTNLPFRIDSEETDRLQPREFTRTFDTTDVDNARRLIHRWGDNLRYVPERDEWMVWDGNAWSFDDAQARRWAVETMEYARRKEHKLAATGDHGTELAKHAKRTLSGRKLDRMLERAADARQVRAPLGTLDSDPWLLAVGNGTLDLRTGELREPRRSDYLTRTVDVDYDADAEAPVFDAFMRKVQPDQERREWLQRAAGYTLTGTLREQAILLPVGDGMNGKSTFVEALAHVLGDGLAKSTQDKTFAGRRDQHPEALARLRGARMVSVTETGHQSKLREGMVKAVTGGERITARFLYEDSFEFRPSFTVWFPVNELPTVMGSDKGIWRRLIPVPFDVTIGQAERDYDLPAKLRQEAEGILSWAVQGALAWQDGGGLQDDQPASISTAKARYKVSMDHVGRFVHDVLETDPKGLVPLDTLYEVAQEWFRREGVGCPTKPVLSRKLSKQHGIETKRRTVGEGRQRVKVGVSLQSAWEHVVREAEPWA